MFLLKILAKEKPVLPNMYLFGLLVTSFFYISQIFGYILVFGDYFEFFETEDKKLTEGQNVTMGLFFVLISLSLSKFLSTLIYLGVDPYRFFEHYSEENNYLDKKRIQIFIVYISLACFMLEKIEAEYYNRFSFFLSVTVTVCLFCFIFLEYYRKILGYKK